MKQLTLLFGIWLLPLISNAQHTFTYATGKPYKVIDAREKHYFSDPRKEKAMSVKWNGKDVFLQSFDGKTMRETGRQVVKDMPSGFQLENISWFQDHLYFFYSLWDRDKETEQLFAREIDFDSGKFTGKGKRIIAVKGKLSGLPTGYTGSWLNIISDKFSFKFSNDSSRMLVQCRKKPEVKRDKINHDVIGMYVFDPELNQVMGNEIKMPYTEKKMDNVDYAVDSGGTPYLLAKVYDDDSTDDSKGRGEERTANYHLELIRVDIANRNVKTTKIEVDKQFIKDIRVYEARGGEGMLCSGFYNIKPSGWTFASALSDGDVDGIFLIRLDKDGNITDRKSYEIPLEIINQFNRNSAQKDNARRDRKGKAEMANLQLRELRVQADNSISLIGEQFYVETYTDARGRNYDTYNYNDMLITKIAPDGSLAWMRKLPKRQYGSRVRGELGFRYLAFGGTHYVVYLDNNRNLDLGLNERPISYVDGRNGYLTAYCVDDATGKVSKVSIFDTRKVKGKTAVHQFSTNRILQISATAFMAEFYKKGKEDLLIRVTVEK